ncbi:MAG: RNA polymerase sigma factor [Candidatus Riflebacteria bacterium]|nr:RNA polymerase sigma factor [Candidatus Riflebacteria bacterium]
MQNNNEIVKAAEVYRMNPRKGFDLLYAALADRISTYLRRAFTIGADEIADVLHDSFLPWVEHPEKMKSVANPRAYLFSTAKYLAIRKKREQVHSTLEDDTHTGFSEHQTEKLDASMDMEKAMSQLSEEQREVVALKIWGDLTFDEIAEIQEVSLNTAASRYRYALQKLKEVL